MRHALADVAGLIGAEIGLPAIIDRSRIVFRCHRPGDLLSPAASALAGAARMRR
jgi:hypothetical protein